jgi:hypothetical protein
VFFGKDIPEVPQRDQLYRIPEFGWFGWTIDADDEVVLYCKLDSQVGGGGYFLATAKSADYSFGRSPIPAGSPPSIEDETLGRFYEEGGDWAWFTDTDSNPFKLPFWARASERASA